MNTEVKPKHEVNRNDDSDGGRDTATNSPKERASKNADTGDAPEQGAPASHGTKQGSEHRDLPATYEPDKKPSERETL